MTLREGEAPSGDALDTMLGTAATSRATFMQLRPLSEALEGIGHAIRLNRACGDDVGVGRCLRLLSRLQWFAGRGEAAHASARDAVAILEPLGPSVELAAAYSVLSRLAMLRREIAEAEAWGTRALVVADRFGHVETRVEALVTLASARLLVDPDADAGVQTALANAKTKVTVHRLLAETVLAELAVRRGADDADERLGALSTRAKETGELQRLVPVFELSIERALLADEQPSLVHLLRYVSGSCAAHTEDVLRIGAWASVAGFPVELTAPPSTPWEPMLRGDWRAAAPVFGAAG
jgi:hypothetical protein